MTPSDYDREFCRFWPAFSRYVDGDQFPRFVEKPTERGGKEEKPTLWWGLAGTTTRERRNLERTETMDNERRKLVNAKSSTVKTLKGILDDLRRLDTRRDDDMDIHMTFDMLVQELRDAADKLDASMNVEA